MTTRPPITRRLCRSVPIVLMSTLVAWGCDDPLPSESGDDHDDTTEELEVELTVSPDHVHTLSEITFTVRVTDHHGEPVTDFEELRVEYKPHDSETWSEIETELDGTAFHGTHTFASSGDYDVRIVGRRAEDASDVVMHEMGDHLHAARAHTSAGGYAVEFEVVPGHVHEGDLATLRFWVSEEGSDAPVAGLEAEIRVTEADDSETTHAAAEPEAGVYEAEHTFGSAEDAAAELHFTGIGGDPAAAAFTFHVAHAH